MGHSSQAVFVSAFSIANCFGRLCAGYAPLPSQAVTVEQDASSSLKHPDTEKRAARRALSRGVRAAWLNREHACRFIPDRAMRHHGTSRILWLVLLSALTMASCCLNAFTSVRLMGLACALSGLAFGGFQGIVPAITSELFGMAHFATNYSLQQLGPALGAR